MKKLIFLFVFIYLFTFSLYSQDNGFGVGLIMGEPTGFTFKNWISSTSAIDAGIGWSFVDNGSTHLHVDYLYHNFNVIKISDAKIPLYFGVGGRLKMKNEEKVADNRFGIRVPVGAAYIFQTVPVDIFLEVVPVVDLSPETRLTFNSALGIRYFFK